MGLFFILETSFLLNQVIQNNHFYFFATGQKSKQPVQRHREKTRR